MKKIYVLINLIIFFCLIIQTNAQNNEKRKFYQIAFEEQLQMLRGEKPISFKRAVFLTENAFYNGKLNYQKFCNEIDTTTKKLKSLIKLKRLEKFKTSGNYAVYTYMMDSIPSNNFKPFSYDFADFMGNKDFSKMFVTKLIRTKSGNCHSLPQYYKILADEIGAKAFLALAPNHLYIKHINEDGQWTNVELTNGGFPRDQWIIKEMAIPIEAIKSEVYMKPLTNKENIALTMLDLAEAYISQNEYDEFSLNIANTALKYFPKCIPLLMTKSNYYASVLEKEKNKKSPDIAFMKKNHQEYLKIIDLENKLGFKDETPEHYQEWVKTIEKEKKR
jgi:hypothetical protein